MLVCVVEKQLFSLSLISLIVKTGNLQIESTYFVISVSE